MFAQIGGWFLGAILGVCQSSPNLDNDPFFGIGSGVRRSLELLLLFKSVYYFLVKAIYLDSLLTCYYFSILLPITLN